MNFDLEDVNHIFRHQQDTTELILKVYSRDNYLTVSVPRKDIATLIPSLSAWQYIGTDAAGTPIFQTIPSTF
jgi:hypothetical protein